MEIDTGAAITIISVQQLKKLEEGAGSFSISKDGVLQLHTYTGQLLHTLGRVWLEVKYSKKTSRLSALVVPGSGLCLLGRDWLHQLHINWSKVCNLQIDDYRNLFLELFKPGLGKLKNYKAKLYMDQDVQPRFFKARTVPYALWEKVEAEIGRLVSDGVLKSVEYSDWAVPIVPVMKPTGEVRICGDYK